MLKRNYYHYMPYTFLQWSVTTMRVNSYGLRHFFLCLFFSFLTICPIVSYANPKKEFSLFDAITLAFSHNKLDLPLVENSRTSALIDHEKNSTDFFSAHIASGIHDEMARNQESPDVHQKNRLTSSLTPQLIGRYQLSSGGTINASLDAPVSAAVASGEVNSYIAGAITFQQPLATALINKNRLQKKYEMDQPEIIAKNDLVERQNFAMTVAHAYFTYANLQSQIRRSEEQLSIARSDVEIANLKYSEGEMAQAEVVTIEAALKTAELECITLAAEAASRHLDIVELFGTPVDTSALFCRLPDTLFSLPHKDSVTEYVLSNSIELKRMTFELEIAKHSSNRATLFEPFFNCSINFNPQWAYMRHLTADNTWYGKAEVVMYLLNSRDRKLNRYAAINEHEKLSILIDRETIRLKRMVIDIFKSLSDTHYQLSALHNSDKALETTYAMAREQFLAGTISRIDLDAYFSQLESNRRAIEEATTTLVLAHLQLLQIQNKLLQFFRIANVE